MVEQEIDLGAMMQKGSDDEIWAIRAKAIQAYAHLEQALCRLFCQIGDMSRDVAGVIFFKITSSQARNDIIHKLFKLKHFSIYTAFGNSLFAKLRPIDLNRNKIVHWNMVTNLTGYENGDKIISTTLKPPTYWIPVPEELKIDTNDLLEFILECKFFSWLINMFVQTTGPHPAFLKPDEQQTWHDIFQQPVVYPPQKDTPLYLTALNNGIQLPPFLPSPLPPASTKKKKGKAS